jgi:hypothetical protein
MAHLQVIQARDENLVPGNMADETDRSTQTFGNSAPSLVVMAAEADGGKCK